MIGWLFFMTMGEKRGNVARRSVFGLLLILNAFFGSASGLTQTERHCQSEKLLPALLNAASKRPKVDTVWATRAT